ncbi:mevalonate kinase [Lewinella sp. IMCC34191]|uniref:mevalonate kinase family protein n=1 Tax=Lewinella sp. IMCC34191 TaxID=2259172 RepID=UPI000E2499E8|nr:hypothetical protein [Lewinella sp. IMCC34191]
MREAYPAKVLLLGEHTVLRGGQALAVPYDRLRLRWAEGTPDPRLLKFATYLDGQDVPIDTDSLGRDLRAGRTLAGNIPVGYGLGSSGAVCAAVLDAYGSPAVTAYSTADLRQLLARMEGHFHGSSSGTDPLLAYLQSPILLGGAGSAEEQPLPEGWAEGWFLIDTGITRDASPLIREFLAAYDRDPLSIDRGWREPADAAIQALIANDREALYRHFASVSDFQLARFPDFIPPAYHDSWNGGDRYRLKICGAGGGGMLLGMARDAVRAEEVFGEELLWLTSGG